MEEIFAYTSQLRTGAAFLFEGKAWQLAETTKQAEQLAITALRAQHLGIETDMPLLLSDVENMAAAAGLSEGELSYGSYTELDSSYAALFSHLTAHHYFPALVPSDKELVGELTVDSITAFHAALPESFSLTQSSQLHLNAAKDVQLHVFTSPFSNLEHMAIQFGELQAELPTLTRLHSSCVTGDLLHSLMCDCHDQLHKAMHDMAEAGSGMLLYLQQEGRGIGLVNKLRAYEQKAQGLDTVQANEALGFVDDDRSFGLAAHMLRTLGISNVALMTNNPRKIAGLEACGITVSARHAHYTKAHAESEAYINTKRIKLGHLDG